MKQKATRVYLKTHFNALSTHVKLKVLHLKYIWTNSFNNCLLCFKKYIYFDVLTNILKHM